MRTWDEANDFSDSLIRDTGAQHASLVHSLVFGQNQLNTLSANAKRKRYRWFDLPTEWRCERIGYFAQEVSERYEEDESTEVLSCSKHAGFVRSLDYFKKRVFSSNLTGYKRIHRGHFGFPSDHVEEGSIGLPDVTDVGLVSPIYIVFRFCKERSTMSTRAMC